MTGCRIELIEALKQGKPIVPVLVDDTPMPAADQLPPAVQELTDFHAVRLRRDPDFEVDAGRLTDAIRSLHRRAMGHEREQMRRQAQGQASTRRSRTKGRLTWLATAGVVLVVLMLAAVLVTNLRRTGPSTTTTTTSDDYCYSSCLSNYKHNVHYNSSYTGEYNFYSACWNYNDSYSFDPKPAGGRVRAGILSVGRPEASSMF